MTIGAQEFEEVGHGETAQEAFYNAREIASYEHGHGGYTGSIAEKDSFKIIPCGINEETIQSKLDECQGDEEHFTQDKWGPCGCIKLSDTSWLFFGVASS